MRTSAASRPDRLLECVPVTSHLKFIFRQPTVVPSKRGTSQTISRSQRLVVMIAGHPDFCRNPDPRTLFVGHGGRGFVGFVRFVGSWGF